MRRIVAIQPGFKGIVQDATIPWLDPLCDYETFVYGLPQHFQSISRSTLILVRRGRLTADLTGELTFPRELVQT